MLLRAPSSAEMLACNYNNNKKNRVFKVDDRDSASSYISNAVTCSFRTST